MPLSPFGAYAGLTSSQLVILVTPCAIRFTTEAPNTLEGMLVSTWTNYITTIACVQHALIKLHMCAVDIKIKFDRGCYLKHRKEGSSIIFVWKTPYKVTFIRCAFTRSTQSPFVFIYDFFINKPVGLFIRWDSWAYQSESVCVKTITRNCARCTHETLLMCIWYQNSGGVQSWAWFRAQSQ